MSPQFFRWLVAGLMVLTIAGRVVAQETATETEASAADGPTTYHDLRRSKDRTTKGFAERYFYLVRTQEWSSLNGKSKVSAKYVEHDPDFKWVKLSAVRGSGANRATREITVELAKLSKTCQSRVKQIDALQKKLDELAAKEEDDADPNAAGTDGSGYGEYGAPMSDERGAEPAAAEATATESPDGGRGSGEGYGEYGEYGQPASAPAAAVAPAAPPVESSDPDPLGFGEIANETPPAAAPGEPGATGAGASFFGPSAGTPPASANPQAGAAAAGRAAPAVDRTQWKSDYLAFLANFTATPSDEGEPTIDWGMLNELRGMHDIVVSNAAQGVEDPYGQYTGEYSQRLGEVRWRAPFVAVKPLETGEQEVQFGLPPLPKPLKLRFLLEAGTSPDEWQAMRPNQPVEFVGRFDVKQANEILVRVRLPE